MLGAGEGRLKQHYYYYYYYYNYYYGQTHSVLGSVCSNRQTKQNQTLTLILPTRISSPATLTMIAVLCSNLLTNFPLVRLHKLPSKVHLQRSLN